MLRQILDVHRAEIPQTGVERQESAFDTADLHALHQVFREVHPRRGSHHGPLLRGEDRLVAFAVLGFDLLAHPARKGRLAQFEERRLEFVVIAVEQEAQRAAARSGVVDHLGHHQVVIAEIELVADTDLARRIDQHVPQTQFAVQLAQQEDFDLGAGLLLVAVQTGRKDLRVVEDEQVALVEIVDDILEDTMLDRALGTVHHHQTRLVAVLDRVLGQHLRLELVPVL